MVIRLLGLFMIGVVQVSHGQKEYGTANFGNKSNKIVIKVEPPNNYLKKFIGIYKYRLESRYNIKNNETVRIEQEIIKGMATCILTNDRPVLLQFDEQVFSPSYLPYIAEPNDSIHIRYINGNAIFSGRGAEKFRLIQKIGYANDSLERIRKNKNLSLPFSKVVSFADYQEWNVLLDSKLDIMEPLLDCYKDSLSTFIYNVIKEWIYYNIEDKRLIKFRTLIGSAQIEKGNTLPKPVNQFGLTNQDLCFLYDSLVNGRASKWLQYDAPFVKLPYYVYTLLSVGIYREKGAFFGESITEMIRNNPEYQYEKMYSLTKKKYKGIILEEALSFIFWNPKGIFDKVGFSPKVDSLLMDYYARSGYPTLRQQVKEHELIERKRRTGENSIDFTFTDANGQLFGKEQLKGKVVVLDFWFTGCVGCVQMMPALKKVEDFFKNDTNIVFVSVSVDEDKKEWLKSVSGGRYTTKRSINVYTGGQGRDHHMIRNYGIEAYPELYFFSALGTMVRQYPKPDPRKDNGKAMIALIQKQLALMKDGPYVFYKKDSIISNKIDGITVITKSLSLQNSLLQVQSDDMKTFNVSLKQELNVEPSEFDRPEKIFVLSDIEGNFEAFRKLLQNSGIMDNNYNWIFGNGHLVFAGDMFDRGEQVTECLWLIYSLEEKAKKAGGYVHFILGNHEIMNLQGNHLYTQIKYKNSATLMGLQLTQLYSEDSELGRWLRTKNIIEKIGDLLFAHGGIDRRIADLPLDISQINKLVRPYYGGSLDSSDNRLLMLYHSGLSPFWYRGYYGHSTSMQSIDSILQRYGVNKVITGHTIVSDTISVHFNGKVINTDTRHAEGKSEALLIEGQAYYRLNSDGQKKLLFALPRKEYLNNLSTN